MDLKTKIKEYLETLDGEKEEEWYTTHRALSEGVLDDFLDFCQPVKICCDKAKDSVRLQNGKFMFKDVEVEYCPFCAKKLTILK